MAATEKRYVNLYVNGKGVASTYNELRKEAGKLRAELNGAKLTQQEFNQKVKQLAQTESAMKAHRASIRKTSKAWSTLKSVALGVVGGNVILGAFQKLTQFIPNLIQQNAKLADSFADVQKTTNLTDAGMEDLNRRLKTIDTRTPRARLLELARDAGKLGIKGVANINGFVKAADQINVSLGEDLGEDAIKQLGKLNNIFKVSDTYGYEQGLLKIGSVINELGANSEASEGNITEFITRLAGVADQADINIQSIAGYGAELDKLGQRTETSGTAVSQAIVGMFKDTPTYAKIAGKSIEEFTKTLNEDANEAFIQFLEGLNGNNEGLGALSKKFDQLGIDGSRAITVLGALSANTEDLRKQQNLANTAFAQGTSLTQEFNRKNENAAANVEKIGRYINRLWVNSGLKNAIDSVTSSLADMIDVPVSENLEQQRTRFNALIGVLRDTNTASDVRKQIIQQINESYPEKLGNMDLEKASLEDLARLQASVNQQYLIEIALTRQKEKLKDIIERQAENVENRRKTSISAQDQLNRSNEALGTSYKTVAEAVADLQSKTAAARKINAITPQVQELRKLSNVIGDVNEVTGEQSQLERELNAQQKEQVGIVQQLKKDYPELANIIDETYAKVNGVAVGGGDDAKPKEGDKKFINGKPATFTGGKWVFDKIEPPTADPDDGTATEAAAAKARYDKLLDVIQKEEEKIRLERLDGRAKEEAEVNTHYDNLAAQAEGYTEELAQIEELRQSRLKEIGDKYAELKADAQAEIDSVLAPATDALDPEVVKAQEKYDALIALAQKYNIDTVALEKAKADAIAVLQRKITQTESEEALRRWQAQAAIMSGAADDILNGLIALNQGAADENARFAKFQQEIGLISMGVSAGVAVANAVKSASILPFPANIAAIAAAVGSVLAFIGKAKQLFNPAEPPEYARGTLNTGSFIAGEQGREIIDGNRVIPAQITQQILAANAFNRSLPQPNFSAINDGLTYTQGRQAEQSSVGGGGGMDLSPLIAEMRAMRSDLQRAQDKEVRFDYTRYRKFKDEVGKAEGQVVFRK